MKTIIQTLLFAEAAFAYPWVSRSPGVDSSMLRSSHRRRQQVPEGAGAEADCPYNPDHVPAAPVTAEFPYNNAINGSEGNGVGGFLVPDPNDPDHQYIAPTSKDIRGPCPGLNTAANYGFLARDGITTYDELVDAQQNVYNVGYDLANLLAFLGLVEDGDLVTQKLSIGCDATNRTSYDVTLTGSEPGLDGHDKFEADTSLTRNDFFLDDGDDFTFNDTLFDMMSTTTGGNFDLEGMALYRAQRWNQSQTENSEFYFGPLSLLLFGAASFVYELMPGGPDYTPDTATITSFFVDEQIPANWTNRVTPYSNSDVTTQIVEMYLLHPVLFGGNTGDGTFDALPSFGAIVDGKIPSTISATETACLLYQLATGSVPSDLNVLITPTVEALEFLAEKVTPSFANLGCSIALD